MSKVFVVDAKRKPLDPVHPGEARLLLKQGKAAVLRRFPFTLILKVVFEKPEVLPLRIKLDPGSKTTGLAIVNDVTGEVVFAAEITHRGQAIKHALDGRRGVRRGRRQRDTRLPPTTLSQSEKTQGLACALTEKPGVQCGDLGETAHAPVSHSCHFSGELVRFDLQVMENPEIAGVEYQQGTLAGYEVREYVLAKWNRKCAYCGKENIPLQVEHIQCKAKGGSDRIANLCLACEPCNLKMVLGADKCA